MHQEVIRIAPSILSANFARLGEQVAQAERCGADRIHLDVMDGHFVPNISFGAVVVEALRPVTRLPLEVHLMITDPDLFLNELVAAAANVLVAGTAIFGAGEGVVEAMQRLQTAANRAVNSREKKGGLSYARE